MTGTDPDGSIDVGVVVVTYNSASTVGALLSTLVDGLGGVVWRIVFVDNASSDRTVAMIRGSGYEVVELDRNSGYAAAINRGVEQLPKARAVLVLNPDLELTSGCARLLLRTIEADDSVGIASPKMYIPDAAEPLDHTQRRDPSLSRTWGTALLGGRLSRRFAATSEAVADPRCYDMPRDLDWAVGAALLIGRPCIDAVGEWDESFFLYSEETDFCQRARRAGFKIRYVPDAVVWHKGGDGLVNPRLRAMMIVNKVREYHRRHGRMASWCFFAGNFFHELTRGLAGRSASRTAAMALISPRRRPVELNASRTLLPR